MKVKDKLKGELKPVCEEKDVEVAHTKNLNRRYENVQATVSDMVYYQIKLHSRIGDLTSDLVVSRESSNKLKQIGLRKALSNSIWRICKKMSQ